MADDLTCLQQIFEKLKSQINPEEEEKRNKELIQRLHAQYEKKQLREATIVRLTKAEGCPLPTLTNSDRRQQHFASDGIRGSRATCGEHQAELPARNSKAIAASRSRWAFYITGGTGRDRQGRQEA
jgi:uncharacterized protein with von Willebrand factor type A (vWA) domain